MTRSRPLGLTLISLFFFSGALMSGLTAVMLLLRSGGNFSRGTRANAPTRPGVEMWAAKRTSSAQKARHFSSVMSESIPRSRFGELSIANLE